MTPKFYPGSATAPAVDAVTAAIAEEAETAASALASNVELRALLHFETERFQRLYMEAVDREKATSDKLGAAASRRIAAERRVAELQAQLEEAVAWPWPLVRFERAPWRIHLGPVTITVGRRR